MSLVLLFFAIFAAESYNSEQRSDSSLSVRPFYPRHRITTLLTDTSMKTCARCDRSFSAEPGDSLRPQSSQVTLNREQQDYVSRNYEGPLCEECLREIREKVRPVTLRELSNFLLDFATTLMSAGVHTSRVVRNVTRIAGSFGYEAEMTIFQRHITLNILHSQDDSVRRTSLRTIRAGAFNFDTISSLSALSWSAHDNHLTLYELREQFNRIVSRPRISRWWVLMLVSFANASFCRLFGGDPWAMGLVFVATLIGFFVRQEMSMRHVNHLAVFIVSAFVASMIASAGVWAALGETPETALGTSVLFLIPGVPLINSIIDLLEGFVLMGISRAVNALSLIICIALGLSATLLILGIHAL